MQHKSYKNQGNMTGNIAELTVDCGTMDAKKASSDRWNPNVPFVGTQEEWWEHFHEIENSKFYPVSEAHQRISQWLDSQEM